MSPLQFKWVFDIRWIDFPFEKPCVFNTLQVIMLPVVVDHLGFSSLAYKSSTLVFRMAVDSTLGASGTSTTTLDKTSGPLCPRATSEDGR